MAGNSSSSNEVTEGVELSPCLSVNVVNIDYTMLYIDQDKDFIEALDSAVPVVRIFGSTASGERACVYIHGAYPYLYFRPEDITDKDFTTLEKVTRFIEPMRWNIEKILNARRKATAEVAAAANKDLNKKPWTSKKFQTHVHKIEVVMKYTMYGFYPDKVPFVKIYLRNPQDINKVVAILEDGALGRVYQPFESHVPFLLQFTTDNNITPMGIHICIHIYIYVYIYVYIYTYLYIHIYININIYT
jgi:DNA polymerase zeta